MYEIRPSPELYLIPWSFMGGAVGASLAPVVWILIHVGFGGVIPSFFVASVAVLPGGLCGILPGIMMHTAAHRLLPDSLTSMSRIWPALAFCSAALSSGTLAWWLVHLSSAIFH
jgi:hypothetical protein